MFHFHTGTMTRRSKKLDSEVPEAYVEINPDDAKKIGLNGNKRVRVTSRRGQIELGVRVTDDIKPRHRVHPLPLCRSGRQYADQLGHRPGGQDPGIQSLCRQG